MLTFFLQTNANEGAPLTNPNVTTLAAYDDYVSQAFPLFDASVKASLDDIYHSKDAVVTADGSPHFETTGDSDPTALTVSGLAAGIQQTVNDISAESTYVCPAYWLANTFSTSKRQAWKYQYSVTPSYHGADLGAYFQGLTPDFPSPDFQDSFSKMLGNFIINNTPIISVADATAGKSNATAPADGDNLNWPVWDCKSPQHMVWNTTGGSLTFQTVTDRLAYNIRSGDGQVNVLSLADAASWEGGRGARCAFWQENAKYVPV